MRVAVIRGDLPGPLFLADLEDVSQYNPPTEPRGQERYLTRPTSASFGAAMALYAPASLGSTADITFPVVVTGLNQTLKLRQSASDAYTSYLIPTGSYANMTLLLAAINSILSGTGAFVAVALGTAPTLRIAIQTVVKGAASRIQYDTTAGGSTANTPLSLAAGGANFTVPAASAVITATVPVGGPVDVRPVTIRTQLGTGLTQAQWEALQNALAPRLIDTDTAVKSFQVGYLSDLRNAAYNPDPNRLPAITPGAAISVVADDGQTLFTASLPLLTNAQFGVPVAGAITLTGTGLAGAGSPNSEVVATRVKIFTAPDTRYIDQARIVAAGGTVSATSIVIPASLVPSGVGVGTQVQVRYTSLASNIFTLV